LSIRKITKKNIKGEKGEFEVKKKKKNVLETSRNF